MCCVIGNVMVFEILSQGQREGALGTGWIDLIDSNKKGRGGEGSIGEERK